jgi:dihydrofolate synthase/folylpolyglutamate synthase
MKFSRYKDVEKFLFSQLPMYQRIGPSAFKKDLKNIKHLCQILGNPQNDFKAIHIAGTNGKGSTSFFVASALHQMGYNVGLYTSPHYKSYMERIRYNGAMIPKNYIRKFVNELFELGVFDGDLKPSFFEISVAMAFAYFRDMRLDYAVVETGLGGRLDSTNILHPVITAITNISFDHTQFLGNTLNSIAKEKGGIIKRHIPIVIGRKQKESYPVFERIAEKKQAELIYAENMPFAIPDNLPKKMPAYQQENMRTAYCILNTLFDSFNAEILRQAWTTKLRQWSYMGRYQVIGKHPKVILDSAHNEGGLQVLFDQINQEKYKRLHIVIAIVNDKDASKLFDILPKDAMYYLSQAKIPRALEREKLKELFDLNGFHSKSYSSVPRALAFAKRAADKQDLVLVTGSIFTVAEVC